MSKKVEKRECAVCGKKFAPKTANAKYCSSKCYKSAKSMRDKKRPVALEEKIALPKKPKKARIVTIHKGDVIKWGPEFSPLRVYDYAVRLLNSVATQIIRDIGEAMACGKKGK